MVYSLRSSPLAIDFTIHFTSLSLTSLFFFLFFQLQTKKIFILAS